MLRNSQAAVAGVAAREAAGKRSRSENGAQRLEKIDSRLENCSGLETSDLQDLVRAVADGEQHASYGGKFSSVQSIENSQNGKNYGDIILDIPTPHC